MTRLARKLKRNSMKSQYKAFCKLWKEAIMSQTLLGKQVVTRFDGTQVTYFNRNLISQRRRERYAERGEPILGKRPTFKAWLLAVNEAARNVATPTEVQEHIESLDWDDEKKEKPQVTIAMPQTGPSESL